MEFESQTYSAESPRYVERTLLLYHFFQKVMYGLEFGQRRNVKPAIPNGMVAALVTVLSIDC